MEILRREVSVCIIIGLTARRGGERKGKEEVESEYVYAVVGRGEGLVALDVSTFWLRA